MNNVKVILATVLSLVLWITPIYLLYLAPAKLLGILLAVALLSCGIIPIVLLAIWVFITMTIWEALGVRL